MTPHRSIKEDLSEAQAILITYFSNMHLLGDANNLLHVYRCTILTARMCKLTGVLFGPTAHKLTF